MSEKTSKYKDVAQTIVAVIGIISGVLGLLKSKENAKKLQDLSVKYENTVTQVNSLSVKYDNAMTQVNSISTEIQKINSDNNQTNSRSKVNNGTEIDQSGNQGEFNNQIYGK